MTEPLQMPDWWKEKEQRAVAQRKANEDALQAGEPLPYPNPWDTIDPTKVAPDATAEEIHQRYLEFRKICRPPKPKRYTI